MKKMLVKYLEDENGVCEVVERDGERVFDEYDQSGDIYLDYEDMFKSEYELLENEFDFDEVQNIELIFEKI